MLEHLRDAEAIAVKLKDDRRRGQVCAFMTTVQATLDELDEALATGGRALQIAEQLDDLKLRLLSTSYLEQAYCYRGEYERVIALATQNIAALPAEWVHDNLGMAVPVSVFDRAWLIMSLAETGRFAEAVAHASEAIRIADATERAFTMGWAHFAASMPYLLKGDWTSANSMVENWLAMLRSGNVAIHLPWAVASSAWALAEMGNTDEALKRVDEAEELLDQQAARGIVGHRGFAYHAIGRACLRLGRLDKARHLAERAVGASQHQPGFAAHALHLLGDLASQPDRFDPENSAAQYHEALGLAQKHDMHPLIAHCHLGLGKLANATGKAAEARKSLGTAIAMYRDMDMAFWLKQAEA
jgi:tetratricopeptide (TPR) repeat protein